MNAVVRLRPHAGSDAWHSPPLQQCRHCNAVFSVRIFRRKFLYRNRLFVACSQITNYNALSPVPQFTRTEVIITSNRPISETWCFDVERQSEWRQTVAHRTPPPPPTNPPAPSHCSTPALRVRRTNKVGDVGSELKIPVYAVMACKVATRKRSFLMLLYKQNKTVDANLRTGTRT
jgi:hypothetical protein